VAPPLAATVATAAAAQTLLQDYSAQWSLEFVYNRKKKREDRENRENSLT
jgi:hypothetical protein